MSGTVLQVALRNLERLKREDACVAAHYGMTVKLVPLPVKRPSRRVVRKLKGSKKPAPPRREIGVVAARATSSFRNVRIINARGGGAKWFQHRR